MWNIEDGECSWKIEVGSLTILKKSHPNWFTLVRKIDDFFNNKNSKVQIYEDNQLINKKDWECLFIPFDSNLQLDKITAKSPLKPILESSIDDLIMTPAYQEFQNIWTELSEELMFIRKKLEQYDLEIEMVPFEPTYFKNYLVLNSLNKVMTPLHYKQILLKIFAKSTIDKNKLLVIELPELFSTTREFQEFETIINELIKKGMKFILVTTRDIPAANTNYLVGDIIINNARFEVIRNKCLSEIPFNSNNDEYNIAKHGIVGLVDNSNDDTDFVEISTHFDHRIKALIYSMLKNLNIETNLDITGMTPNLARFLEDIS
ncbi:hypothetical protein RZN22_07525 [Bacillaceae bacterium S4-13-58]